MNKEQVAEMLNGRQYHEEIPTELKDHVDFKKFVIIFGASDDIASIEGVVRDEYGCFDGGKFYFDAIGLVEIEEDFYEQGNSVNVDHLLEVSSKWCESDTYSWTYETEVPHASFDILEDDSKYCRGIVFDASELENYGSKVISMKEYNEYQKLKGE